MEKYVIDDNKKQLFGAIFLLDLIFDKGWKFPVDISEPLYIIFVRMKEKGLVVEQNDEFVITEDGTKFIQNFYDKYQEFLRVYDIYCSVDLVAGEFAFAKIFDMSEEDWQKYLADKRWDDVRVAVCEFKKIDPLEIVFMSFLREERIDTEKTEWKTELLNGTMWGDIENICNTAIHVDQLNQDGGADQLTPDDVIKDIITRGSNLIIELLKKEKQQKEQDLQDKSNDIEETTTITEEIQVVDDDINYYNPYIYDPYYVSPCWGMYYYDDPYWW